MKKALVLIDGENFSHKVRSALAGAKTEVKLENIKLRALIGNVFRPFSDIEIAEIRYYAAKLLLLPETLNKSKALIDSQRKLKSNLEKQNITFIIGGNVRPQYSEQNGVKKAVSFKEKGVDVRIAVDMVAHACDKTYDTLILCSSDSDLQPAVREARARGLEVIYLGFDTNPNKGLTFTTNKTVLFRAPEILKAF